MTPIQMARKYRPDLPWVPSSNCDVAVCFIGAEYSVGLRKVGDKWDLRWHERGGFNTMPGKTLAEKFEHLRGHAESRLSVLRDAVALAEAVAR